MAKYYGTIGFARTIETPAGSGIWQESIVEQNYYGDVNRMSRRWVSASNLNDNLDIINEISIVIANPFALNNFQSIRYATWMNTKWKVSSVEVNYPRLTLSLGGVYNGGDSGTSDTEDGASQSTEDSSGNE